MVSYLEIQLRKQRHSKAIVDRNNARRQLLLKQQPDVGDTTENTSGEEVPIEHRSYWEDDESEGYDPRIRWIRGSEGAYYYDGRAGVRTFGDTIPEGFVSEREFNAVADNIAVITGQNLEGVRGELENAESSLSFTWGAALAGAYRANPPDAISGTDMELINGMIDAYGMGTGSVALEAAGRRLVTAAQTMRSDQVAALAEDGVYTTQYVEQSIRQRENEAAQEGIDAVRTARVMREVTRSSFGEEGQEPETVGIQPETSSLTPHRKVNVSDEVFESLSPWGQQSLDSDELAGNNLSLYEDFPDVWIKDAGDAVKPDRYLDAGTEKTVPQNKRGPFRVSSSYRTSFPADMVNKANRNVDMFNRAALEIYANVEGGSLEIVLPEVSKYYQNLLGGARAVGLRPKQSIQQVAREEGVDEETISKLKRRATTFTFEEWMKLRDDTYQQKLQAARNQQAKNKDNYGSYGQQRIEVFKENARGVVGSPTSRWIQEHGPVILDAYDSFTKLGNLKIPVSARVWPPTRMGLKYKVGGDNSDFTNGFQTGSEAGFTSGYELSMSVLISTWFAYKSKSPISISYISTKRRCIHNLSPSF